MILVFLIVSSGISGKVFFNQWNDYRNTVLLLYAGVLYWIGIQGYRQTQTLKLKRHKENALPIPDKASITVIQKLDAVMKDQKLFQNPELSITDLSKAVGISERTISGAINKNGKNFYQFINEYRVNEVQEKLKNPQNHNLKIISMAYDSGFNSKASFNRIFKSYTGLTPKEYQSQSASQKTLFET